ncbi:DUF3073 domain-containing protein [Jatrophihabitans cynanchi]|uniref:DUF3073 domain-containing protein n=1 Tax=Jatrophihabitans cynanchi TaxID=2944128 RepID=A0ABY7JU12_9ACTN|nr:DUF3073 domain-containing protein [Jatrophihabitans sp. SB3-54]
MARELKYNSHHTDLDALQRELGGSPSYPADTAEYEDEDEDDRGDWVRAGH